MNPQNDVERGYYTYYGYIQVLCILNKRHDGIETLTKITNYITIDLSV